MGLEPVLLRRRITHVGLAIMFILAPLPFAHSADKGSLPWEISADTITHQQEPEKIIAEGEVILQQYKEDAPTGFKITADRIQYNVDVNSVDATGNLHMQDQYDELRAAEARIDLTEQTGFFKQANIFWQNTNLSISADLIEKTAIQSYHFINGRLTTCPPKKDKAPDWSIWGRDVKITLNDYAKLRHATFRVRDVPVFYLPYLSIPLQEKKSGLLFPEYSTSSRNGIGMLSFV